MAAGEEEAEVLSNSFALVLTASLAPSPPDLMGHQQSTRG